MAVMRLYAGSTIEGMTEIPSPVELKRSTEQIWSENTGRAQSGTNRAKMIGDVVATKLTYSIKWGILTYDEYNRITSKLTKGFFYFAAATSISDARANAYKFYRGDLSCDIVQAGDGIRYKDVSTTLIEQ